MNDKNEYFDEKELVEGCIRGNSLMQQKLFRKYYGYMLSICLRYTGNRDEAKDILQEGFIKVFNNLTTFKFEGSLKGWIKRIMINNCIDKYRKTINEPEISDIDYHHNIESSESVISSFTTDELLGFISKMPNGYRTIFNLYVIEGYSHKEIGEMLGISEGTSKSQLFKAKSLLKQVIDKEYLNHG